MAPREQTRESLFKGHLLSQGGYHYLFLLPHIVIIREKQGIEPHYYISGASRDGIHWSSLLEILFLIRFTVAYLNSIYSLLYIKIILYILF